mmetsp:Transcript_63189/g.206220  ORF Transcript_63189/g.206220 Transcript_63189/m.206220 type:complete len:217 (-) Transcript_63189:856-1506(-)
MASEPSPSANVSNFPNVASSMSILRFAKTSLNSSLSKEPLLSLSIVQNCRRRTVSFKGPAPARDLPSFMTNSCHCTLTSNIRLNSRHSMVLLPSSSAISTMFSTFPLSKEIPIWLNACINSLTSKEPSPLVSILSNSLRKDFSSTGTFRCWIFAPTCAMRACHSMVLWRGGSRFSCALAFFLGRVSLATVLTTWNILRNSSHSIVPLPSLSAMDTN